MRTVSTSDLHFFGMSDELDSRSSRHGGYITGLDLDRLAEAVAPEPHWLDLEKLPGWYGDLARCLVNGMPKHVIAKLMGVCLNTVTARVEELQALLVALRSAANCEKSAGFAGLWPPANQAESARPAVTTSYVAEPGRFAAVEYASCSPRDRATLAHAATVAAPRHRYAASFGYDVLDMLN